MLFFSLPLSTHFADIFVRQHIILHLLPTTFGDQEERHGQQEKAYHPKSNTFVSQYGICFHLQEAIDNASQGAQDYKKDKESDSFTHLREQN